MPSKTESNADEELNIDFSDIEARFAPEPPKGFDSVIVVDKAPIVDGSKEKKLIDVVKKVFKNIGPIKDVVMPMDTATGKSKG